jgi:nucleoside-diphosphate-sugar epimerase
MTSWGKVFVTGGAGHVGNNLVRRLVDDGHDVRCLVLGGADNRGLEGLAVELVEGDIRDFDSMLRATKGCDRVFHVAAKVSTLNPSAGEQRDLFDINVHGVRNVMRAAMHNGVTRAVLTGSFSATGHDLDDPSRPSNEDLPFYPFEGSLPYARTKVLAEHEMLKCVVDGLDGVIATSCACVGPNDWLPSRMGRTMIDYANGRLRVFIDGGFDFVNARDLVQGHMLAMEKGRTGQKYIFSTHFHTLADFVQMFSETLGLPPVTLKLPGPLMAGLTGLYSGTLTKLFPNVPQRLTPGAIKILRMRRHADTTKAQTELGYRPTDLRSAVREAFAFFHREGVIPVRPVEAEPQPAAAE